MEKIMSNYDHKAYMRMEMLKHEKTFRAQVHELHRLYQIQKVLMQSSVRISQHSHQQKHLQESYLVDSNKGFTIDYNNHQLEATQRSNLTTNDISYESEIRGSPIAKPYNNIADESEIELTLNLGSSTHDPRRQKMDSGHDSFSSSSTGSNQTRKTRGDQLMTWDSSTFTIAQGSDFKPGFSNGHPNNSPWSFQALSLKLT